MFKQFLKRPHFAIISALLIVVVAAGAALLFTRNGSDAKASSDLQPYAARIDRVDGSVGMARVDDGDKQLDWAEASVNTPVSVGDRIYARENAHASVALSGRNYVRLNPDTAIDVLTLEEQRTQLALRDGSALFEVGALDDDDYYEVATPCGAVDFREPGLYQIGMDGGDAIISVLSGLAQVVGQGGSGYISKGQVFTLAAAAATQVVASALTQDVAGGIVDDYYHYRYPRVYDGRYRSYDAYLNDPFYYDPYRTSVSYQYVSADVPGVYDLDDYGDWVDVDNYGHCWAPRVNAGWAPFRAGYWDVNDIWGPSWISSEPWGWAPYHYGRWAFVNQRWFWVPAEVRTRAVYSPASVAFIPVDEQIAWIPLGPGEAYVPRYYDVNYRPRYLASAEAINVVTVQRTFVNFNAPGAITVVPVRSFTRIVDSRTLTAVDTGLIARSRPVIDPFTVDGLRELAISGDGSRRRIRLERREREAFNRPVLTGATSEVAAVRGEAAKSLSIERLSEKTKKNKLNIEQASPVTTARGQGGLPQTKASSERMSELASRAEQGDKSARREMRRLMRDEQRGATASVQGQQAQQEQSRQQIREQRKAEQAAAATQQEAARQAQQQMKQQRKAERQQQAAAAAQQAEQQGAARKAQRQQMRQQQQQQMQQQEQTRQQRKAERQQQAAAAAQQAQKQGAARQAERQQMRQQQQQQEQIRQQQKQQQKQQKRERRPPDASAQQQAQVEQARIRRAQQQQASQAQMMQQREQFKAQKRAEQQRQVVMQQQASQAQMAQQQREQFKAQKRAEQQRQMVMQQQAPGAQAAPRSQAPQVREATGSRAERKAEKWQRKSGQQ